MAEEVYVTHFSMKQWNLDIKILQNITEKELQTNILPVYDAKKSLTKYQVETSNI